MGWLTEFAPTTAGLSDCIDCGLCLSVCPTFSLTGDESASPRGRIAAMRAVDLGIADVDDRFVGVVDLCLQCLACETACPSLVSFGTLMEGARAEVVAHQPDAVAIGKRAIFGKLIGFRIALVVLSWFLAIAQRLRITNVLPGAASKAAALREVPIPVPVTAGHEWLPDGDPIGTVGFLSGCVMDQWYSGVHVAVIEVLRTAGYRVVAPKEQTCCGAIAAHEGAAHDARRMAERNVEAFADFDLVVVDSAGCSAHMKDYAHWADGGADLATRVIDANEIVARLIANGDLPSVEGDGEPIAVQDPCHLRHAQGIVEEPRAILRAAGLEPVEIDPIGMCCGAAGAYQLSHPEISDQLGRRKASQVEETGLKRVASANPGCEMQLKTYLDGGFEVQHPIELYWQAVARHK
ncbi:MAG: (Fe-S)-binding protein [Actinomycetota bacterium]